MSYVIHLFSGPMPRTLADAVTLSEQSGEHPRGQNPLFIKLAQELTKRYPCIMDIDEDDEETPAVWSDGPLDGKTSSTVYVIGVQTDWVDEVQPFVVETATSLGLNVLDHQQGQAYLPGGKVLKHEGEAVGNHLGTPLYGQLNHSMIERTLNDALLPILMPLGFEASRAMGGLWRTGDYGSQLLRFVAQESSPEKINFDLELIINLGSFRKFIEYILQNCPDSGEKYVGSACCPLATACRFYRRVSDLTEMSPSIHFAISSLDELRRLAIALRQLFAENLNPLLDEWTTSSNLAYYLYASSHDAWRILGSQLSCSDDGTTLTKATISGTLLTTAQCAGECTAVLLGALANVPREMLEGRLNLAYHTIKRQPAAQQAHEKAKLDLVVKLIANAGKYPPDDDLIADH